MKHFYKIFTGVWIALICIGVLLGVEATETYAICSVAFAVLSIGEKT